MLATTTKNYGSVIDLESNLTDGRLTEPSNGQRFKWREMIREAERLGRPLTEDEAKAYKVN